MNIEPELDPKLQEDLLLAAKAIKGATALLLTSGAGLGVDSGLPDFRGPEGFWKAYPPMKKLGLQFPMMSNPKWFGTDPAFAWGFWGHRYKLYTSAAPHEGYDIMLRLAQKMEHEYFVFTSNVDGHWIKSGTPPEKVFECHGSIHYLQCVNECSDIWPSSESLGGLIVDESSFRAQAPLPCCKSCSSLARPNVVMFDDFTVLHKRLDQQVTNYKKWVKSLKESKSVKLVVIEIGAGEAVPTVRYQSEMMADQFSGQLIRINPRDTKIPHISGGPHISIPMGGMNAMKKILELIQKI